jgi:hypothetical protein
MGVPYLDFPSDIYFSYQEKECAIHYRGAGATGCPSRLYIGSCNKAVIFEG